MSKCKDCHKEVICETPQFSECVSYEGFIADGSPLHGECAVNVRMVLEDLYQTYGSEGFQYFAGEGLELNSRTFSVDFGTTSGTVMEGSWRPMWSDIINRPNIPEQVNIIGGDNVSVTGNYPNIIINADTNTEQVNIIGGTNVTVGGVYPNYIISATYTPTTHTGDVTGTTNLTIANSAVTNQKLANMPANTIKGRQGSLGTPQDLTPQQAKEVIGATQQTIVTTSSQTSITLTLNNCLTTGLFLDRATKDVIIPDGEFEGQSIFIYTNQPASVQGKMIDWKNSSSVLPSFTTETASHLFWNSSIPAWVVGKL